MFKEMQLDEVILMGLCIVLALGLLIYAIIWAVGKINKGMNKEDVGADEKKVIELRQQNHPELEEGEVFLGNATPEDFYQEYTWSTKRPGMIAFDLEGNRVPDLVPVFAKRKELEARGFTLVEEDNQPR